MTKNNAGRKITIPELTKQVGRLGLIPRQELPYFDIVLEEKTKEKLAQRSPQDVAMFMLRAIEQVNRGSVEKVDTLVIRPMEESR